MGNQHKVAFEAVRGNTFGNFSDMVEVVHKKPWGFYQEGCQIIHIDDFLLGKDSDVFKTITMHILMGNGCETKKVLQSIEKSFKKCVRLLILEHNPDHKDWTRNKKVSQAKISDIETLLKNNNMPFTKSVLGDGRNILYTVSTIPFFDWSDIEKGTFICGTIKVESPDDYISISASRHKTVKKQEVYTGCSEDRRRPEKLLDDEIVDFIEPLNLPLYSVCGGMMALDALSQYTPPKIYLLDCSFKQVLFSSIIINEIIANKTLEGFDMFLENGITDPTLIKKVDLMWDSKKINQYLDAPDYWNNDKCWRNVLKVGKWRDVYQEVRKKLIEGLHSIQVGNWQTIKIYEDKAILYTSTIRERYLPENKSHLLLCAMEIGFSGDCLEYLNGEFVPFGTGGRGRDTVKIVKRKL